MGMGRRPSYTRKVTALNAACAAPPPPAQNQESTIEDLWLATADELNNPPRLFQRANPGECSAPRPATGYSQVKL